MKASAGNVTVRVMRESDLADADRIFRLAFGTFLGLPDPMAFAGDSDWIAGRWRADPTAAFVAERDGVLVGSNLATRWGSVGTFGPLSVRPDLWDAGIAHRLLDPVMERFAAWGTTHAGLFTFAQSAKHVSLYGRYGFHPRFLTAVMTKPIATPSPSTCTVYSALPESERSTVVDSCRSLTDGLYDGLDVTREIQAVATQRLGDTILLQDGDRLLGFAVCHTGPRTEAGSRTCYIKFAALRSGSTPTDLAHLLDACESVAATHGTTHLMAGTNLARETTYRTLLARGYRTALQGVAMHRPNDPAYSRPDVLALDDWR